MNRRPRGRFTSPAEAWETLATRGFIGAEDVDNPRRGFVPPQRAEVFDPDLPVFSHPPTIAACVALASDWPGVLAAETIAQDCYPGILFHWCVGLEEQGFFYALGNGTFKALEALGYGKLDVTHTTITLGCPGLDEV